MNEAIIEEIFREIVSLRRELSDLQERLQGNGGNGERLTPNQVADMAGVNRKTVHKYVNDGRLYCRYPMAKKCFHRDDVDAFLRGISVKGNKNGRF